MWVKENLVIIGRNFNWCFHGQKQYGGTSKKKSMELPHDPANPSKISMYIQRKWKQISVYPYSLQYCSHSWICGNKVYQWKLDKVNAVYIYSERYLVFKKKQILKIKIMCVFNCFHELVLLVDISFISFLKFIPVHFILFEAVENGIIS